MSSIRKTGKQIALGQAIAEFEMIAALHECMNFLNDKDFEGRDLTRDAKALLHEYGWDGTNEHQVGKGIIQRAKDNAASLCVRSGWESIDSKKGLQPLEYRIELAGGGPGVSIYGDFDLMGKPVDPIIKYCHSDCPWTEYNAPYDECLNWYVQLFNWGVPAYR